MVLSPSLTNGFFKLGSLTVGMRSGEMDWVDTHLDWKLWGEAGARNKIGTCQRMQDYRKPIELHETVQDYRRSTRKGCVKRKGAELRTLNSFIRYFTMKRRSSR